MRMRPALFVSILCHVLLAAFSSTGVYLPHFSWTDGASKGEIFLFPLPSSKAAKQPKRLIARNGAPFLQKSVSAQISTERLEGHIVTKDDEVTLQEVLASGNLKPIYPEEAIERGWEGTVRITVALDGEGRVGSVSLKESSGYGILDFEAMVTASEWVFPVVKRALRKGHMFVVPVVFRIEG